jgi:nitrate/nitrite transporter NarK
MVLVAIVVVLAPLLIVYFVMLLNIGVYSWLPIGGYIVIIAWFYIRAQKQAAKKYDELHKRPLLESIDQRVEEYKRFIEKNDD